MGDTFQLANKQSGGINMQKNGVVMQQLISNGTRHYV
jgi:hypothetical protein